MILFIGLLTAIVGGGSIYTVLGGTLGLFHAGLFGIAVGVLSGAITRASDR